MEITLFLVFGFGFVFVFLKRGASHLDDHVLLQFDMSGSKRSTRENPISHTRLAISSKNPPKVQSVFPSPTTSPTSSSCSQGHGRFLDRPQQSSSKDLIDTLESNHRQLFSGPHGKANNSHMDSHLLYVFNTYILV